MASLALENISKTFGGVRAVQGVSLNIRDGEFVSLLGPSGCGKTTTLRMIAGLESSDGGKIQIAERDVTALPPRDRDIAMVFQDYALYPHMDVLENVGYPLKVRGVSRTELTARVQEVATRLQIDMLLTRKPGQLSGGQQQRVALARAVVHHAQVTLYDEPLSNLDTQLRNEARVFLKHLQREVGVTSVYVTHDQAEAMALSDRIVVMNQGRVMQIGSPMDIYRTPANTFVASFIGSPPMNLLKCQVDPATHTLRLAEAVSFPYGAIRGAAALDTLPEVTFGIRPEHIQLRTEPAEGWLPAKLYIVQELGSETLAIFRVNEQLITVRVYSDELPALPEQLWLEFLPARAFLYGKDGNLLT